MSSDYIVPVTYLIERAFKNTDLQKFEHYISLLEAEAQKISEGIYETVLSRDVFIAYSSKDMDKVLSLLQTLEENGFTCFAAMRNLQHGRNAVANYEQALQTAMDNCAILIFVSSKNSRSFACDALKQELPYLKRKEMENAPLEYRNGTYSSLPARYKKPRIEYRLDNERTLAADMLLKEFFAGLDYCETEEKVLGRVVEYITARFNAPAPTENAHVPMVSTTTTVASTQPTPAPISAPASSNKQTAPIVQGKEPAATLTLEETRKKYLLDKRYKTAEYLEAFKYWKNSILSVNTDILQKVSNGILVLPERAEETGSFTFQKHDYIREVYVNDNTTVIGYASFNQCKNLKKVSLPNGLQKIEDSAFESCSSLEEIILPEGLIKIGMWAFKGCTNLKKIVIPESVEKIADGAFEKCHNLTIYVRAKVKPKKWGSNFWSNWNGDNRPVVWGYKG